MTEDEHQAYQAYLDQNAEKQAANQSYVEETPEDSDQFAQQGQATEFAGSYDYNNTQSSFANFTNIFPAPRIANIHIYKNCGNSFLSRNRLFRHLDLPCRTHGQAVAKNDVAIANHLAELPKKISTIPPKGIGTGFGYRGYTYATINLRLQKGAETVSICWDTGCNVSIVDRAFLKAIIPDAKIRTMA
jgi:hypothetical protein